MWGIESSSTLWRVPFTWLVQFMSIFLYLFLKNYETHIYSWKTMNKKLIKKQWQISKAWQLWPGGACIFWKCSTVFGDWQELLGSWHIWSAFGVIPLVFNDMIGKSASNIDELMMSVFQTEAVRSHNLHFSSWQKAQISDSDIANVKKM